MTAWHLFLVNCSRRLSEWRARGFLSPLQCVARLGRLALLGRSQ